MGSDVFFSGSQNGLRKWCKSIANPYQMGDNKAAPSAPPQGGGASRRPLGVLVVTHLVRISYVFAPFSEPVLAPGNNLFTRRAVNIL